MVRIEGEIPFADLMTHRASAITELSQNLDLPGFRKGHVPADIAEKHIGAHHILTEMAERALAITYPKILESEKINAIGRPEVTITKIAEGNPLGFTIRTATLPSFELPDYAKISRDVKEEKAELVTNKEINDALLRVRRYMHAVNQAREEDKLKKENPDAEIPKAEGPKDDELPELTDEFVATLGEHKTVAEFTERVRKDLSEEKERAAKEKRRIAIIEAILAKTTIPLPAILVDAESEKLMERLKSDIARTGAKLEDYFAHIGKSEDEVKKEMRPSAERNAKMQLVLNAIAEKENIMPDEEKMKHEVTHLKSHYPKADERALAVHVATVLTNEAVLTFLETENKP